MSETREIPLTQGKVAIVDAEDYERLAQFKWYAKRKRDLWYAARAPWNPDTKRQKTVQMHRVILSAPDSMDVDHRDGNGLNNSRSNLRLATKSQNRWNQGVPKNSSSGVKGVRWNAREKKWRATIHHAGKALFLGQFTSIDAAAIAYQQAAQKLRGEFARTA